MTIIARISSSVSAALSEASKKSGLQEFRRGIRGHKAGDFRLRVGTSKIAHHDRSAGRNQLADFFERGRRDRGYGARSY